MSKSKILIHTALYPEAKPLIQYFNLVQNKTYKPIKIFENEKYILVICGVGQEKTKQLLPFVYETFSIHKAINIGIAGCKDKSIKLGTLCCTNRSIDGICTESLTTVDEALDDEKRLHTTLVDMEAKIFLEISLKNLHEKDVYVFKIVSDYLSKKIPNKSFVYNHIEKSICKWENVI